MAELTFQDGSEAVRRLPKRLQEVMQLPEWQSRIFVAGGFIRAVIAGEPVSDIDVFVKSPADAEALAIKLAGISPETYAHLISRTKAGVLVTENAITLESFNPVVQIIHKYTFQSAVDVVNNFDFSVCCAAIWYGEQTTIDGNVQPYSHMGWGSYCDARFYPDLAARRLIYRRPDRAENAGSSLLRVLKFYQRGYLIDTEQFAAVVARLMASYSPTLEYKLSEEHIQEGLVNLFNPPAPQSLEPKVNSVTAPKYVRIGCATKY